MPEEKVFLHLSDIHFFREGLDSRVDLDQDLRSELERSARSFTETIGQGVDGILVTGDVAFQGSKREYEVATEWLKELSGLVDCEENEVWVVPGNHDVQRSEIQGSMHIKGFHDKIRQARPSEIDGLLRQFLIEDTIGGALLKPLSNYRDFAAGYGCDFDHEKLFWEDHFQLNDGWKLCVRGVNSALISSSKDTNRQNKLVLGTHQVQIKRKRGVAHMILCHHPPDWLLDYEQVNSFFSSRTSLQLYGHKHTQRTDRVNDSLRLVAGALHPDRGHLGWEPRYNFLRISVVGEEESRELRVKVTHKCWNQETTSFETERESTTGEAFFQYDLPLNMDGPDFASLDGASITDESLDQPESLNTGQVASPALQSSESGKDDMDRFRSIRYRYFDLPPTKKLRIALDLDLLLEEDAELSKNEMYRAVLRRAKEKGRLEDLWDHIAEAEGESVPAENPFR